MNTDIFVELSVILVITLLITSIIRVLKQPSIIGYIISGIVAGPFILDLISSTDTFTALAQQGVALLLFLVGLNLNPKVIKDVGIVSLVTGIGQVVFTTSIGFGVGKLLGLSTIAALYAGIALAFSSTIVIMKLLSDKKELESLYGRISVGFLIVQDFIVILLLLAISSISSGVDFTNLAAQSLLAGVGSVIILFLLTVYVLPKILQVVARSQEFLFLFSLTWCFAIASIFFHLNFSIEAGALLAGVTLSLSPYHFEISSKMKSLRDFFLILFFIMLGSQMLFDNLLANLGLIIFFSLIVLIGNPLIVMTIMGLMGYTKRNGFLAGLSVAQISEFSLILVTLGVAHGHVDATILSIVTAVALITFAGSTYMIMYSNRIYAVLSKYLFIFERRGKKIDEHKHGRGINHDIILFGYNRIGYDILDSLTKIKRKFLVIDYDPRVIGTLSKQGFDCRYGDANNSELLEELNLKKAKMVISTIPLIDTNLLIIKKTLEANPACIIAVVSHQIDDALKLYDQGATYVIMPHFLGGKHFSTMIGKNRLGINKFLKEKIAHIEHITERKKMGHHHPTHEK